jgi:hypothetical protein
MISRENFSHSSPADAAPTSTLRFYDDRLSDRRLITSPLFDEKEKGFVKQNIPLKNTINFIS